METKAQTKMKTNKEKIISQKNYERIYCLENIDLISGSVETISL